MAIDSEAKRRSALAFGGFNRTLPAGDGTIDQGDRQHALWQWRGILASPPHVPDLVTYIMTVTEVSQPVMEIL